MTVRQAAALIGLLALGPGLAVGQSPDAAAERARLANQRIQAEAERRAREELESQNQTSALARQPAPASALPGSSPATDEPVEPVRTGQPAPAAEAVHASSPPRPGPAVEDERTSRALEQLRDLGELKDAGYLTEEEFRRIKTRIIESQF